MSSRIRYIWLNTDAQWEIVPFRKLLHAIKALPRHFHEASSESKIAFWRAQVPVQAIRVKRGAKVTHSKLRSVFDLASELQAPPRRAPRRRPFVDIDGDPIQVPEDVERQALAAPPTAEAAVPEPIPTFSPPAQTIRTNIGTQVSNNTSTLTIQRAWRAYLPTYDDGDTDGR